MQFNNVWKYPFVQFSILFQFYSLVLTMDGKKLLCISCMIFLLPSVFTFCFFPSYSGNIRWGVGCNFGYTNDFEITYGQSFLSCAENCRTNPGCTHFAVGVLGSTVYPNGPCMLKNYNISSSSNLNLNQADVNANCGYVPSRMSQTLIAAENVGNCPASTVLVNRAFDPFNPLWYY